MKITKCDHTKSIQANLNQTKLKQTKKDHTNVTKIQASPLLSVCPILSTYKLTFPNRTHKLDQTKITINGFGMAKRAAQLLYGPVLVSISFARQNVLHQQETVCFQSLKALCSCNIFVAPMKNHK